MLTYKGPAPFASKQGFKYYVNFLDDFSRFSWIYPLRTKGEALPIFKEFKKLVEKQFLLPIKNFHSYSEGEFIAFTPFLKEQGISQLFTYPHTLEQNDRVEQKHRQVVESGLTLLAQANMPLTFWWEAFQAAVHNINRLPSSPLHNKTPFEILYKTKPDYTSLHPFGCSTFPCLTPYNSHKLQFHSKKCLFMGYSNNKKGFKCLSASGRQYISRHAVFNHSEFPYLTLFSSPAQTSTNSTALQLVPFNFQIPNNSRNTDNSSGSISNAAG